MYKSGFDFWDSMVDNYGLLEALDKANKYLEAHKRTRSKAGKQFCKELETAVRIDVYLYL